MSLFTLNQRISGLQAQINNLPPAQIPNLEDVLDKGNNAGTFDIDMNNQNILNCENIQLQTINDIPITTFQDTLEQVLTNGNEANNKSIILKSSINELELESNQINIFDDTDELSIDRFGITTKNELTLNVGLDIVINGDSIIETTAGGYASNYLKIKINGQYYKLQLLAN